MNVRNTVIAIALFAMAFSSNAAIEGVTTNSSTFNASLIVITNRPILDNANTNISVNTVGKAKVTNKQLLSLCAFWMGTNWPAGAHLAFDWQTYQVVVVDQSGTNVLMYCLDDFRTGDGTITTNVVVKTHRHGHGFVTVTNITYVTNFVDGRFIQVDWFHGVGASSENLNAANPGSDKVLALDGSYLHIHDNIANTHITCQGGNTQKFSQTWDANGNGLIWKDSEATKLNYYGGQSISGIVNSTVGGTLTSAGTGKGYNPKMF